MCTAAAAREKCQSACPAAAAALTAHATDGSIDARPLRITDMSHQRIAEMPVEVRLCLPLAAVLAASIVRPAAAQERGDTADTLFQVATLAALLRGDYDGKTSFRDLRRHGDFGLGTFEQLDGEMIALDGRFYQVRIDGVPRRVANDQRTPFAALTRFAPEEALSVEGEASCAQLEELLEQRLSTRAQPAAIRVVGHFAELSTRSVPAQSKPYVPLADALQQQIVFDLRDVDATMVGFWTPDVLGAVNVAGFHFHAITQDVTAGGHVLDCYAHDVEIEIDYLANVVIQLAEPVRGDEPTVNSRVD